MLPFLCFSLVLPFLCFSLVVPFLCCSLVVPFLCCSLVTWPTPDSEITPLILVLLIMWLCVHACTCTQIQEDTETAKYVHRLGQLQHRFYKSSRANLRWVMHPHNPAHPNPICYQRQIVLQHLVVRVRELSVRLSDWCSTGDGQGLLSCGAETVEGSSQAAWLSGQGNGLGTEKWGVWILVVFRFVWRWVAFEEVLLGTTSPADGGRGT